MTSAREGTDAHPVYRREGEYTLLEVTLDDVRQFFHTLDPAPFRQKDLDASAEEYIVEAVREIGQRGPLKLVVYLPPDAIGSGDARTLGAAVRNYFNYRSRERGLTLRRILRRGIASLLVGVLFLALCLSLREVVATSGWGTGTAILGEGLLIVGWIALWRPVEIFLYDWWPIREDQRLYAWIARQAVEVRPRAH